jgi:8-oxo-dGTP diphosphatase
MAKPYVTSAKAAEAVGVGLSTLQAWAARGIVTPAWRTPGGQARWDVDDLRRQLKMPAPSAAEATPAARPAIVAAIVTSALGVLVGRRNDGEPPWTFIAGEVEPGESPEDAAVREVKEETGCLVRAGEIIGERDHPATGRHMVYLAGYPTHGTDVFVGDEAELAEVRWVSLAEADELLPGMFGPVRDYLARAIGRQAS